MAGRKEERVPADLRVTFASGEGVARNVSANGIYFVTHCVLAEGEQVELKIEFPDLPGGGLEVTCRGRVVRVQDEGSARGVAAAFASLEFRRTPEPGAKRDQN